jgi:hypothetical protein
VLPDNSRAYVVNGSPGNAERLPVDSPVSS